MRECCFVDDAAGIFGGASHRTSLAQSSSVYVSLLASSMASLRREGTPERAEEEDETADLAPADKVRGRVLEAIVIVSTEAVGCLLPRSELAVVVGLVEDACEGAEKMSSPPPLVEDATEDIEVSEGVRETEDVSSSRGLGAKADLER